MLKVLLLLVNEHLFRTFKNKINKALTTVVYLKIDAIFLLTKFKSMNKLKRNEVSKIVNDLIKGHENDP